MTIATLSPPPTAAAAPVSGLSLSLPAAGIKKGYTTTRIIRQVDVAPTIAYLGGVRMPRECEGALAYQIFEEEF